MLFHAPDGIAYADVTVGAHRETWPVESRGFREWLERLFYTREQTAAGRQALADALGTLQAAARYDGPERAVHLRVAPGSPTLSLDLCNAAWEAVEVTAHGWRVVPQPSMRFRRTAGMLALPTPARGGSLDDLQRFLTLEADEDFHLVVVWMLAALLGRPPFAVLVMEGEHGSGKSVLCRMIRSLVDPSTVPLRAPPREEHDLAIAASNGWIVGFDNLSGLPLHLSDALCRLSTGGGFGTRRLYTDREEELFDGTRPVLLNGIGRFVHQPDLADRSIVLQLPVLADTRRRTEAEFWAAFEVARPAIFGSLLDALVGIVRELPSVRLNERPRMADFAEVGVAVEAALGWVRGSFLQAYTGKRDEAVREGLDSDPVGAAVLEFMSSRSEWEGTASELYAVLGSDSARHLVTWPRDPAALSKRMARLAPGLRAVGIQWERGGRTSTRRACRLRRGGDSPVTAVIPVMTQTGAGFGNDGSYDRSPPP
jgi:hypothetical protein